MGTGKKTSQEQAPAVVAKASALWNHGDTEWIGKGGHLLRWAIARVLGGEPFAVTIGRGSVLVVYRTGPEEIVAIKCAAPLREVRGIVLDPVSATSPPPIGPSPLEEALDVLAEAYRELATIKAITVSPSRVDGLIELVRHMKSVLSKHGRGNEGVEADFARLRAELTEALDQLIEAEYYLTTCDALLDGPGASDDPESGVGAIVAGLRAVLHKHGRELFRGSDKIEEEK